MISSSPPSFSPSLMMEARRIHEQPLGDDPRRVDLCHLPCVCIDSAHAKDADDALWCSPRSDGGWDVGVHIADPGYFVAPASSLDLEAQGRATSIYLPSGTIPMFPALLSEGTFSLEAGKRRPALTTQLRITKDLELEHVEIFASWICVSETLTYEAVNHRLSEDARTPRDHMLHALSFLANELFAKRLEQGAICLEIPEPVVRLEGGSVAVDVMDLSDPAESLVSDWMIEANAQMATFCHEHDIAAIYRSQAPPEDDLYGPQWAALPEGLAREMYLRGKMPPSQINLTPSPHAALGLERYIQATSPIRRYTDLMCQRQLTAHLRGQPVPYTSEVLLEVATKAETIRREAKLRERAARCLAIAQWLGSQGERTFSAEVVGRRPGTKGVVWIAEVAMEAECELPARVALGDQVQAKFLKHDARRGHLVVRVGR